MIPSMHGLHLTADLRGCAVTVPPMTDVQALRALCLSAVRAAGLQPVGELFHRFGAHGAPATGAPTDAPTGVTGVVLLAESHLAVHTWPELNAVTLDVYVCNLHEDNSRRAESLMATLEDAFGAQHTERHRVQRGTLAEAGGAGAADSPAPIPPSAPRSRAG
jgi:S-adenosylmethionine decarboxylase